MGSTVAHEHKSSRLTSAPNTRGVSIVFTGSIQHAGQSSGESFAGSDHYYAQGAIFRLPPAYYRRISPLSRGLGSLYYSGTGWERQFDGLDVPPSRNKRGSLSGLRLRGGTNHGIHQTHGKRRAYKENTAHPSAARFNSAKSPWLCAFLVFRGSNCSHGRRQKPEEWPGKAAQSHIKATPKPVDSHLIGTPKPLQGYHKGVTVTGGFSLVQSLNVPSPLDDLPAMRPGVEARGPLDRQGSVEGGKAGKALPPRDQTVPRAPRGPRRSLAGYTP